MEETEKEKLFESEYETLLKKYNVSLVIENSILEEGLFSEPHFKESGKYCNINFVPDYKEEDLGRCVMVG
jgi:hypothetical protein